MTTATPDFRDLAIQALADNSAMYPPAGWAEDFDAAHAYIPAWALGSDKPHELFLRAAREGRSPPSNGTAVPTYGGQLWNQVAAWLRAHPEAPELATKEAEIRAAWDHNHEYPEDWAPYQRMIDEAAVDDVPY